MQYMHGLFYMPCMYCILKRNYSKSEQKKIQIFNGFGFRMFGIQAPTVIAIASIPFQPHMFASINLSFKAKHKKFQNYVYGKSKLACIL